MAVAPVVVAAASGASRAYSVRASFLFLQSGRLVCVFLLFKKYMRTYERTRLAVVAVVVVIITWIYIPTYTCMQQRAPPRPSVAAAAARGPLAATAPAPSPTS